MDIAVLCPQLTPAELDYANFIKDRLTKAGGSLVLQHLMGHLSQMKSQSRAAVGTTPRDIKNLLSKCEKVFLMDGGSVKIVGTPEGKGTVNNPETKDKQPHQNSNSTYPLKLVAVNGIVIKVCASFGFISIKEPVKTSVYFTPACFKEEKKTLLTDFPDIVPGKKVVLNAKKGNEGFESKYRATEVWMPKKVDGEVLFRDGFRKKPKSSDDGLFDPETLEYRGTIDNLFETHGFIIIDNNRNNNVFFHHSRLCNAKNVTDLRQMLKVGDEVEFKAMRSKKERVRWEATKVWIRKQSASVGFQPKDIDATPNGHPKMNEIRNQSGKVYPRNDGAVIKFGVAGLQMADADSCLFYMRGARVEDVAWEFTDGDSVTFDAVKINSAPGYKALLAWVGNKPKVSIIPEIDTVGFSDQEVEDALNDRSAPPIASRTFERSRSAHSRNSNHRKSNSPVRNFNRPLAKHNSREFVPRKTKQENFPSYPKAVASESTLRRLTNSEFSSTSSLVSNSTKSSDSNYAQKSNRSHKSTKSERFQELSTSHSRSSNSIQTIDRGGAKTMDRSPSSGDRRLESRESNVAVGDSRTFRTYHSGTSEMKKTSSEESFSSSSVSIEGYLKQNSCEYKNWGDSPWAGDEEEPIEADSAERLLETPKESPVLNVKGQSPVESSAGSSSRQKVCTSNRFLKLVQSDSNSSDYEDVEDEFQSDDDIGEKIEDFLSNGNVDPEAEGVASDAHRLEPSIKIFSDLEGKLRKVYCRYAEIEHGDLHQPAALLWGDFYYKGVHFPDKYSNLNEVLAPGQSIHFSCIEIVDDKGVHHQKTTLSWIGQKPGIAEMTPQNYIKENHLQVSTDVVVQGNAPKKTPQSMRHLNSPPKTTDPPRKFFAVSVMSDDDDEEQDPSRSASSSSADAVTYNADEEPAVTAEDPVAATAEQDYRAVRDEVLCQSAMGVDRLSMAISRMILAYKKSQIIDVEDVSSDIVNLVLNNVDVQRAQGSSSAVPSCDIRGAASSEATLPATTRGETTDSYAQTIITGKIFSQSVFLEDA